jgi:glycosyltransferase involved in cell wall biosynthesis
VGLIPFRPNQVSAGATPGKLFQYLAAGLPVITTRFFDPTTLGLGEYVVCASAEPQEFAEAIVRAATADSTALRASRKNAVQTHTWDARFTEIESALKAHR